MIDYEAGAIALFEADRANLTLGFNYASLADHVQDAYRRKSKACVDAAIGKNDGKDSLKLRQ